MSPDLWQSGLADSVLKAKARRVPGCGGFGLLPL